MKTRILLTTAAGLILAIALLFAGCGAADSTPSEEAAGPDVLQTATMSKVYSADRLYSCPMHSEVVSADHEQACPLCGMRLDPMSASAAAELRLADLHGCPMDPIIVEGDAEQDCPVCGMDLLEVHPHHDGEQHGDHEGGHDGADDDHQSGHGHH
jgi:hypothetical protein